MQRRLCIAAQSGGWSITWQGGGDLTNANFPGATSIGAGIAQAVLASGGRATLSADGKFTASPDVAVVVFGEPAYAEFMGDRLDHRFDDEEGLALLKRFKASGIRTVAVLLSGRPMWLNRELNVADAFVAAWLPGSEGQGVADVLIGTADGRPRHDFSGHLSVDWPADCAPGSAALYAAGFGQSYATPAPMPVLALRCRAVAGAPSLTTLFARTPGHGVSLIARDASGERPVQRWIGSSPSGAVKLSAFDLEAQEDARAIEFTAKGDLDLLLATPVGRVGSVEIQFTLVTPPIGAVTLGATRTVALESTLKLAADKGYRTARIPLACLADAPIAKLGFHADAPVALRLRSLRIVPEPGPSSCQGPF